MDQTKAGVQSVTTNFSKLNQEAQKTGQSMNRSMDAASKGVSKFDQVQEKTQRKLAQWMKQKYQVLLEAKDAISPVMNKIGAGLRSFGSRTWKTTMKVADLATKPLQGVMKLLKNPVFQVGAVLGVSVGFKDTIDTFKNFEAAMSQVKAVSGATTDEFEQLNEKAKQMGATTKFTATESAEAMNYMAMAGWKTKDMLNGIDGIMNLAAASGENLGTVSDIVTDALTAFGLTANDSTHFADVLAAASSNANTNVAMMGETFKYVAPVAGALKYSIEDTALAIGLMANSGIKSSMAGTSLRRIFSEISGGAILTGKELGKYQLKTKNADGSMRKLKDVMDDLRMAFGKMSDSEKAANAEAIAGKTAMAGMLAIVNASDRDYRKLSEAINHSDGAAQEMAETMMDNLQGAFTLLQSAADGVKLALGSRLAPYLREFAEWLTSLMPDLEQDIDRFMDQFDDFADQFRQRIKEMTASDEWKNADLFGKISIAWDTIIVEPFSEWWNSTGHRKVADVVGNIGNAIGRGFSSGILGLLGIDVANVSDEGASIGAAFAKGLSDGFDLSAITKNLGGVFKGMASSAGELLPGGETAGFSSLLSAVVLSKLIGKVGRSVAGGGRFARSILFDTTVASGAGASVAGMGGAGTGAGVITELGLISLLKKGIGSFSVAGELSGAGMASGTGLLGLLGKAGMVLGSGASTSAGLVAAGTAGIGGAVVGGASIISAIKDIYTAVKASKAGDEEKSDVYTQAGLMKGTHAGAGASAGALIGSFFGGIGAIPGALIGSGIGGLIGKFRGDKIKEDYEQKQQEKQARKLKELKAESVTGYSYEQLKKMSIGSRDLQEALDDTSISAEEFGAMFQEAVDDNIVQHFGKVSLSLKEIKELAGQIVGGDKVAELKAYTIATEDVQSSLAALEGSMQRVQKWNWKASTGVQFSADNIKEYENAMENLAENTGTYLEDKHYESNAALELLFDEGKERDKLKKQLDEYYKYYSDEVAKKEKELSELVEKGLKDDHLSKKEQKDIQQKQAEIEAVAKQLDKSDTKESKAEREALIAKYRDMGIDRKSFEEIQEEGKLQLEEREKKEFEALQETYKWLDDAVNLPKEKGGISSATAKKRKAKAADNYHKHMQEANNDFVKMQFDVLGSGYSTEIKRNNPKINSASNFMRLGMEAITSSGMSFDAETVSKVLGLDNLSAEAQAGIAQTLQDIYNTLPEEMQKQKGLQSVIPAMDLALVTSFGTMTAGTAAGKVISDNLLSGVNDLIATSIFLGNTTNETLRQNFLSAGNGVGNHVASDISNNILSETEILKRACNQLRSNAAQYLTSAFSVPFNVGAQVNFAITTAQVVANALNNSGGKNGKTKGKSEEKFANGGITSGKRLSWICEEGPEAIIPLVPGRRNRALELYRQTGEMLGVEKHAAGGIIGHNNSLMSNIQDNKDVFKLYKNDNFDTTKIFDDDDSTDNSNIAVTTNQEEKTTPISVNVQVSPTFNLPQGEIDESKIMSVIKKHIQEMADELGGEIGKKLQDVFSNMPVKG